MAGFTITVLSINNSTIINNSGGGIFHQTGIVTINNSTVSGNSGGGIFTFGGTVNLTNSTVSSNFGSSVGGGITIESGGTVNLTNATVAFNSASAANGGGIYRGNTNTAVNARNSIIASNIGGMVASDLPERLIRKVII